MVSKIINIAGLISFWIIIQVEILYSAEPGDIVITEYFYKSNGDVYEYVELYNASGSEIDLQNWKLDAGYFTNKQITQNLIIPINGFVVLVGGFGIDGRFASQNTDNTFTIKKASNDPDYYSTADSLLLPNFYWLAFNLPDDSGTIKIKDGNNVIDSVSYNSEYKFNESGYGFPGGYSNIGKAVEYILLPDKSSNAESLNDVGSNWRSSEFMDLSKMFNTSGVVEKGSPGRANAIPTIISQFTTNLINGHLYPDGYPGGNAIVSVDGAGSGINGYSITTYEWTSTGGKLTQPQIDINNLSLDTLSLATDDFPEPDTFQVRLTVIDSQGIMGKMDTSFIVFAEYNLPPVVESIHGLNNSTIEVFEDTLLSLVGLVTDFELCNLECSVDDLENISDVYDNSSPFLWKSDNIDYIQTTTENTTLFMAPSINSINNMSANDSTISLTYQLIASDPFGKSDTNSINIIVHNKNKNPIVSLHTDNMNAIDLIGGHSFRLFISNNNQIMVSTYDESGVPLDTNIIAGVSDEDNDLLNIKILGSKCSAGYENNYCYSGDIIKTNVSTSYDSLIIPFIVDDEDSTAIEGYLNNNTSILDELVIRNIKSINSYVYFNRFQLEDDNHYHFPEDTTLLIDIEFSVLFKLDNNEVYNFNSTNINWLIQKPDWLGWEESEQRVLANGIENSFTIDSLSYNYNGPTGLKIVIIGNENNNFTLSESIILDIPIHIDHRNDIPMIDTIEFSSTLIPDDNNHYHLIEDTTKAYFGLKVIEFDFDSSLNRDTWYDLSNLVWEITYLDTDNIKRVFINERIINYTTANIQNFIQDIIDLDPNIFVFKIDSLYKDFNGSTSLEFRVADQDTLSAPFTLDLFIDQKNDAPIIESITFANNAIDLDDGYYHLPEDTVNIGFSFQFSDVDAFPNLNHTPFNINDLSWKFYKFDWEDTLRLFPIKNEIDEGFIINSLYPNYNGETGLHVVITDNGNGVYSDSLSYEFELPIYIDQRNDNSPFKLHSQIRNYSIDNTTINRVRGELFFRLPQYKEVSGNDTLWISDSLANKIRFQWENAIDADMNPKINLDTLYQQYYRLQLIDRENGDTTILKNDFTLKDCNQPCDKLVLLDPPNYCGISHDTVCVDIDILDHGSLDVTGKNTYAWQVISQNLSQDKLKNDSLQISSGWDSTDFRIDLIPPKVTDFNIIVNKMYPGYYDVMWESNGLYLTDSTFITINEESNQFGEISQRNPRRVTDSLYHFTGILPNNITSASINYNLQLRDKAMNSRERSDIVSYTHVDPSNLTSFSSPSGLAHVIIQKTGVDKPLGIFSTEENINTITGRNVSNIFQISPSVHFTPKEIILNNKGEISFDINEYLFVDINDWQYVIMKINDGRYEQLDTYYSDGIVSAHINELSSFAVYVNLDNTKPIPTTFKLQPNYPNPFNPTTIIPLEIPEESFIKASIYNILGQEVIILLEGIQPSGYQQLQWNGKNQFGQKSSSGIYFVHVQYNGNIFTNKMMLLK